GSAAALTAGALRALRETWNAYFDVQTAERKLEYATALVASAEGAYAATLATYQRGLGTVLDLLAAQRDLADARPTILHTRALAVGASGARERGAVGGRAGGARGRSVPATPARAGGAGRFRCRHRARPVFHQLLRPRGARSMPR